MENQLIKSDNLTHSQKFIDVSLRHLKEVAIREVSYTYNPSTSKRCAKAVDLLASIFKAEGEQIDRSSKGDREGQQLSRTVQTNQLVELIGLLSKFHSPLDKHDGK